LTKSVEHRIIGIEKVLLVNGQPLNSRDCLKEPRLEWETAGGSSYGLKATIQIVTRKMNDRKSYRVTSIAPSLEETNRLPLLTTPACIIGSTDKFSTVILAHLFRPLCVDKSST